MEFPKITLVGVGLLGGSIGLAVKQRGLAGCVAGLVRREESIAECTKVGVVDMATLDSAEAVELMNKYAEEGKGVSYARRALVCADRNRQNRVFHFANDRHFGVRTSEGTHAPLAYPSTNKRIGRSGL